MNLTLGKVPSMPIAFCVTNKKSASRGFVVQRCFSVCATAVVASCECVFLCVWHDTDLLRESVCDTLDTYVTDAADPCRADFSLVYRCFF